MTRVLPSSALFGLLALLVGVGPLATAACAAGLQPLPEAGGVQLAPTAEVADPPQADGTAALPTPLTPEID